MNPSQSTHYRLVSSQLKTICLKGKRLALLENNSRQVILFNALTQPWNFASAMEMLLKALVDEIELLGHIKPERILVGNTFSRPGRHRQISFARILAIRLDRHRQPSLPPLIFTDREYDYAITFCLPRFWELPFDQKLAVVIHELYHISPAADGSLRRLGRKKHAHGSRAGYEARLRPMLTQALENPQIIELSDFLKYNTHELFKSYKMVAIRPLRIARVKAVVNG